MKKSQCCLSTGSYVREHWREKTKVAGQNPISSPALQICSKMPTEMTRLDEPYTKLFYISAGLVLHQQVVMVY